MTGTALLSAHSLRLRYLPTKKRNFVAKKFMDKGLVGTRLRYPYEVRDTKNYFDDIPDMKAAEGHAPTRRAHPRNESR